jgi:hypothetical protein
MAFHFIPRRAIRVTTLVETIAIDGHSGCQYAISAVLTPTIVVNPRPTCQAIRVNHRAVRHAIGVAAPGAAQAKPTACASIKQQSKAEKQSDGQNQEDISDQWDVSSLFP